MSSHPKKKKTLDKYFKNGQNSDANYAQLKYLEGYYQKKKKYLEGC